MANSSSKGKRKSTETEELVLTPGGWRPISKVFKVEPGHHAEVQGGRLKVIHTATGKIVADLGTVRKPNAKNTKGGQPMKKTRPPKPTD